MASSHEMGTLINMFENKCNMQTAEAIVAKYIDDTQGIDADESRQQNSFGEVQWELADGGEGADGFSDGEAVFITIAQAPTGIILAITPSDQSRRDLTLGEQVFTSPEAFTQALERTLANL